MPPEISQAIIDDPNTLLRQALVGQDLTRITRLITSSSATSGVSNIPFITRNAEARLGALLTRFRAV